MTHKHNGGPAFPIPVDDERDCYGRFESGYGGMTLRDYFAAKAMQGLTSSPLETEKLSHAANKSLKVFVVEQAVAIADALLAELEKTK